MKAPELLRYRAPYDWPSMLEYLRARAIDGVERVEGGAYLRTLCHEGETGTIEVVHTPRLGGVTVTSRMPSDRADAAIVARVRRLFDLDADVKAIARHLRRDPSLAPHVAARPGLRAPGGWDGFELAARAVLGQQVSLEAGRRLACQLARLAGSAHPASARARRAGSSDHPALTIVFPTAAQVASANLGALRMPAARKSTLVAVAKAACADPFLFHAQGTLIDTLARLRAIRGVGDWTAHYIALRAAREPDAFPASDIGLLRGASLSGGGTRPTPAELLERAELWRPWRAYAAQHLWAADAAVRALRE
jgi:AraC family transcriptional regulator, regulatory protein of adaptative response / DNA-3-methyladenine glycosylase II